MSEDLFSEIDEKLKRGEKITLDKCIDALKKHNKKVFVIPISDKGAIELNEARRAA